MTKEKLKRWYTTFAVIVLNTLILLFVLNILSALFFHLWDSRTKQQILEQIDFPSEEDSKVAAKLWSNGMPPFVYEPFTQFKHEPVEGEFINVAPEGFRAVIDQGPWPLDSDAFNVFVFGGSTTFGVRLTDDQTIPSYLQENLRDPTCTSQINVYNFGRAAYFSSQERILFQQLIVAGSVPDAAIFIDGLNDFFYADGIPAATDNLSKFQSQTPADIFLIGFYSLPISNMVKMIASLFQKDAPDTIKTQTDIDQVIRTWNENRKIVQAIADVYDIQTLFVWQPVPTYHYDIQYHPVAQGRLDYFGEHQRSRPGYEMMAQQREALDLGDHFLWLADIQEGRDEALYIDSIHYTAAFSEEIAGYIADHLIARDMVSCSDKPP